jgi:hypothetical protein
MQPEPLPLRLSCPWRATAATAVVRSAMLLPRAAIGAARLAVRMLAAGTSIAAMQA